MSLNPLSRRQQGSGKSAQAVLGELELAVMRIAWSRPAVTVRDVLARLVKELSLAFTTVMTVMNRIVDKGLPSLR